MLKKKNIYFFALFQYVVTPTILESRVLKSELKDNAEFQLHLF